MIKKGRFERGTKTENSTRIGSRKRNSGVMAKPQVTAEAIPAANAQKGSRRGRCLNARINSFSLLEFVLQRLEDPIKFIC